MSDEVSQPTSGEDVAEFEPITSQEDFDKRVGQRVARERAKFGDYEDLKSKAAKLAEIESANLTELEREREARETLQRELEELRSTSERSRIVAEVANELDVPPDLIRGSTEDEIRDHAALLAAAISERSAPRPPKPNPAQGQVGSNNSAGDWLRASFGR